MRSGTNSGVIDRSGYSVAGADRKVLVRGCGDRILGDSAFTSPFTSFELSECLIPLTVGSGDASRFGSCNAPRRGPVRAADGRICWKPWDAATSSIDLKY